MIETLVTSAATSATKSLIAKTVGETWEFLLNKYKLRDIEDFKKKYIAHCEKILHVKTLASQDQAVFIDDIYVPLQLEGVNTISIEVMGKTTLDFVNRAILIKGLAGQGKSTILRKLLANDAKIVGRLPIFYELKNYQGGTIESAIAKNLEQSGIALSTEHVKIVLDDSNVKLYLDAFDETPPEFRSELLEEIGRLINRYNCHLICTTRPDTELNSLVHADIYRVAPLSSEQVEAIIYKTSADPDKAFELCEALRRSPLHQGPESILRSPILVVLFCISYNLGEEIPTTLSQFYANIFDTVFYRHDNLKGKVNRIRHWNDNRRIYRALFDYFCFISQRSGVNSFTREKFTDFIADSLAYMSEDKYLADKVADELISITNLVIQDGFNEYRFVHKSIQEFFSSSLICSLSTDKKVGFYKLCRTDVAFNSVFSNTLFFLEEIDYYAYCEYYLIPAVSNLLNLSKKPLEEDFLPDTELGKL